MLLIVGDNISTDEILPAGARVLPFRSNIPEISRFAFEAVDSSYPHARRPRVPVVTLWWAGKTMARAPAENTPCWRHGFSDCGSSLPRVSPGFTGKT